MKTEDIKKIQNGDNAPLAEIYLKHKSYCLIHLSKTRRFKLQDIEDAYQEAIFILRTKIIEDKFESKNVSSYLLTVTWNLLRNQYRRNYRIISLDGNQIELHSLEPEIEADNDPTTEKRLQIIEKILGELSPKCQEFLRGYYQEGMSLKKMYAVSNYSTYNSIKSTKSRCCKQFKEKLKDYLDNTHTQIRSNG